MRYTLSTLLLVVLFAGSIVGCWVRSTPWVHDPDFKREDLGKIMGGRGKLELIASDNRILKYFPSSYEPEPSLSIELWDGRGRYIAAFPYQ